MVTLDETFSKLSTRDACHQEPYYSLVLLDTPDWPHGIQLQAFGEVDAMPETWF